MSTPAFMRHLPYIALVAVAWCVFALSIITPCHAQPIALPDFASDLEAHAWLRKHSPYYNTMAEEVEKEGAVSYGVLEARTGGLVERGSGGRRILLSKELKGACRLSVQIFELTNLYQQRQHDAVDERARSGSIKTPEEFGLLHELIEYDGLRYHRFVLAELEAVLEGGIPREMLTWINPELTNLVSYELPLAFEFVEAQAKSGHTAHYHEWFWTQKREAPKAAR
ncbi:hypothetical protein [Roseimicrobium sp. ORNL1]|uniref:hypothetical protein n=1 Tax=Roseimicrobium sp. ORNL1 TaxID=2711231 RepID=UPI0013E16EBE|nr:hypothetical protein [Roseimicrobium sp. ORNL1]QIF05888.1 hypothetical protein G5S37_31820 [Roseimicrobium sp. ORNL1]